jgi:hypothetical protein
MHRFKQASKEAIMKIFYLASMGTAFIICFFAFVFFPLPLGNATLFHLNAFSVTLHSALNVAMFIILGWVLLKSRANYLVAVDVKHSTVIARK